MREPFLVRADGAEPVGEGEFAALMAGLGPIGPDEAGHPVCIAVSGGGDSMALAVLARRWRRHVLALVVDHALRAESAAEADLTCQRLAEHDIPAQKLTLGPLRSGGLQDRAREGRFDALESACVAAGGSVVLLAHHAADQEETLWMRQERGSGSRGMCGMAGRSVRGRIALLRPLLCIRPQRLRASLGAAGMGWCEDPSNQNRRFRRVAVRQDLTPEQRRRMHHLRKTASASQNMDEKHLARLLACWVSWQAEGWVKLSPESLSSGLCLSKMADDALYPGDGPNAGGMDADRLALLQRELLARLIRLIGGQAYLPERKAVETLLRAGHGALGRACLRPLEGKEAGWMLYREARNLEESCPAEHGQCWDGRWRYLGPARGDAVIAALGEQAGVLRVGRSVPGCVLPGLPALWTGGEVVAVAEGMRGLQDGLPRLPFVWDGGIPVTGERRWS